MAKIPRGGSREAGYWVANAYERSHVLDNNGGRVCPGCAAELVRDGWAADELGGALQRAGLLYQGALPDLPQGVFETRDRALTYSAARYSWALGRVQPDDVIVRTSRPPLDDELGSPVQRSGSALQGDLLDAARTVFTRLGQSKARAGRSAERRMTIDPHTVPTLPDFFPRDQSFTVHGECVCRELGLEGTHVPEGFPWKAVQREMYGTATGVAIVQSRVRVGDRQARLLMAFSMANTPTLIWAHLLASVGRDLLYEALQAPEPTLLVGRWPSLTPIPDPLDLASWVPRLGAQIAAVPIVGPARAGKAPNRSGVFPAVQVARKATGPRGVE